MTEAPYFVRDSDTRMANERVPLDGSVNTAKVAAANKDGAVGTPSMRTLGTGALQALVGSHGPLTTGVHGITAVPAGRTSLGDGAGPVASGLSTHLGYHAGNAVTDSWGVYIGYQAGRVATTGYGVFVGLQAGYSTTTGSPTCVGYGAGYYTTGNGTFLGLLAGFNTTTGLPICIGLQAGYANVDGHGIYIGYQAGFSATGDGVCIGYFAGYNSTIGGGIYLGHLAGFLATTGSGISIGFGSGYSPNGLPANATTSADEYVFIGRETGLSSAVQYNGGVAVGYRALVGAANAIAFGRLAAANHAESVALGAATATTRANEVAIGARSLGFLNAATVPAGAETGMYLEAGALKYRDGGGNVNAVGIAVSAVAPVNPVVGALWVDTSI